MKDIKKNLGKNSKLDIINIYNNVKLIILPTITLKFIILMRFKLTSSKLVN